MFYNEKTPDGLFIWNDNTKGKYGPFISIFSKNEWFGKPQQEDFCTRYEKQYPGYKYSIGCTEKKVFILDTQGEVMIKNIS